MRIEYVEPTIIDKLNEAIAAACSDNRRMAGIKLSASELQEYCELTGYVFSKNCGYTYKHIRLSYDWSCRFGEDE